MSVALWRRLLGLAGQKRKARPTRRQLDWRSARRRQSSAYGLRERVGSEWLREKRCIGRSTLDRFGFAISGDEEDRLIGAFCADLARDLGAGQSGHDEIQHHQIGRFTFERSQALATVARLSHAIALIVEACDDESA